MVKKSRNTETFDRMLQLIMNKPANPLARLFHDKKSGQDKSKLNPAG